MMSLSVFVPVEGRVMILNHYQHHHHHHHHHHRRTCKHVMCTCRSATLERPERPQQKKVKKATQRGERRFVDSGGVATSRSTCEGASMHATVSNL